MIFDRWLRVLDRLEVDYPADDDRELLKRAKEYVDARVYRADIVQTLPAQSEPAHLYVMPGDPNLYIGAQGGGYRRIPTQAV